jgi:hypothetical protein
VKRAPLSPWQKMGAYVLLLTWGKKHCRRMVKDLVIAADQILFNYQNRRAARHLEAQSRKAQAQANVKLIASTRRDKAV